MTQSDFAYFVCLPRLSLMLLYFVSYLIILIKDATCHRCDTCYRAVLRLIHLTTLIRHSAHRPLYTGASVLFGCLSCLRCTAVPLLFFGLPELHEFLLHQAHLVEVIEAEHVHPPLPPLALLLVLL